MSFWSYITPAHSISKAWASIKVASTAIGRIPSGLREGLPDQGTTPSDDGTDLRTIQDSAERFNAIYTGNGWSEETLREQRMACVRTKLTCFVLMIVSISCSILAFLVLPFFSLMVATPVLGCLIILCAAQGFKFALYQAQIDTRNLISAKEFANMDDFFYRLIG